MHEDTAAGLMLVALGVFVLAAAALGHAATGGSGVAALTAVWLGTRLLVRGRRDRLAIPAARCRQRRAVAPEKL